MSNLKLHESHDPLKIHDPTSGAAAALDRAERLLGSAQEYVAKDPLFEGARRLGEEGDRHWLEAWLDSVPQISPQLHCDVQCVWEQSRIESEMPTRNRWLVSVSSGSQASLSGRFTAEQSKDATNVLIRHNALVLELILEDGELKMTKLEASPSEEHVILPINENDQLDPTAETRLACSECAGAGCVTCGGTGERQASVFARLQKFTEAAKETNVAVSGVPRNPDIVAEGLTLGVEG
jgi:hypothetical protein